MKRTLLVILAALLAVGGMPCLQTAGTAADGRKLWATVGDNDTHLLPDSYEKTLKKYTDGTLKEVRNWSGWKKRPCEQPFRLFYTAGGYSASRACDWGSGERNRCSDQKRKHYRYLFI